MYEQGALFDLPPPDWTQPWALRRISYETAALWFARYHYIGTTVATWWYWGVFAPDMVAAVAVGLPAQRHGVVAKFGLERWLGNREITRVAVHPDAPRFTASRAIAMAMADCAKTTGEQWVFSYADSGQGHHGGIYQALGAVYLGTSAPVDSYVVDGVRMHGRSFFEVYGSHSREMLDAVRATGKEIVVVPDPSKLLYVLPIGDKASRRAIRRHLVPYELPYPKREGAAG